MDNKGLTVTLEPIALEAIEFGFSDDQAISWIISKGAVDYEAAKEAYDTIKKVFEEGTRCQYMIIIVLIVIWNLRKP